MDYYPDPVFSQSVIFFQFLFIPLFKARRNARIASAVLAIAIPSVCPSVRLSVCLSHAGIMSKRRHVARCSLHCQIAKWSRFVDTKNIPQRRPLPLKFWLQVTYPLPKAASFDTFCLVAPQPQEIEKEVQLHLKELDTGFPTSHQSRFYAAPNFLKMGIKYLNLSSFGQFRQ